MNNFIFISPTFPKSYIRFPIEWSRIGGTALAIGEDPYEALPTELKEALTEYYQVASLEDYDPVYRAVAWFAHKHGKIDWLESNNEYWLEQDARLRTDFNILTGDKNEDVLRFKYKSNMKAYYEKAGVPTARYHLVSTLEKGLEFIQTVGYPVIVKPNNGVGANNTWKIHDEKELKEFYEMDLPVQYIMEEFLTGYIESFDGIVNLDNEIVFSTCHMFPQPIMEIVNDEDECFYYSLREIPADLKDVGERVIHAFDLRGRFFHTEYFRLTKDQPGLAKKGDLVGLEVNMRPPGGYTTDMMNFANDIDIYRIYANMAMYNEGLYETTRPFLCAYVARRDKEKYKYDDEAIFKKYGEAICVNDRMPELLAVAMGNEFYIARFETEKECELFAKYVLMKKKEKKK